MSLLGKEGRALYSEWKEKLRKHNSYIVKNKFHKEKKMDIWHKELANINNDYRRKFADLEKKKKQEKKETK